MLILHFDSMLFSCLELPSITTSDLANSVISLLRGAGLLDNLTKIVEKTRTQDEHLLTDKLEMVKGMLTFTPLTSNRCKYHQGQIHSKG